MWGEGGGRQAEDEREEGALWGGEEGLEEGQGVAGAGEGGKMGGCPGTEGSAAEEPVLLRKRSGFSSVLWFRCRLPPVSVSVTHARKNTQAGGNGADCSSRVHLSHHDGGTGSTCAHIFSCTSIDVISSNY